MFKNRKHHQKLSAEELKSKLVSHFHTSGSLDKIRSEIRGKLITELFKIVPPDDHPNGKCMTTDFEKVLLPLQICNWFIYDHFLRQDYQYSLSTFIAEANVPHPEKLLSACDILGLFGLDKNTTEYKTICEAYSKSNNSGQVSSLLLAVIKCLLDLTTKNENVPNPKKSFENPSQSFNRADLFECSEKPLSKSAVFEEDLDFSFHVQSVREEKEREVQELRHKLLNELDRLHSQERLEKMALEVEKKQIKRELEALQMEKEKFKEKEEVLSKEYKNKMEKRVREIEVDFSSKLYSKEQEMEDLLKKFQYEERRLYEKDSEITNYKTINDTLKKELEDIKNAYRITKEKYSVLLDENTSLVQKFESMADYALLKENLELKTNKFSDLQHELENMSRTACKEKEKLVERNRTLENQLKLVQAQLTEAQRQLNATKNTLHMEESVWNRERRKLENDTTASKEMYSHLIHRLEEQKEDIQALHHTIHILHYQLTDKNIQNNSNLESSVPYRISHKSVTTPKISEVRMNDLKESPQKEESSLKFISEARNRIKNLQKEADALQDKFSAVYCAPSEFFHNSRHEMFYSASDLNTRECAPPLLPFENLIRNEMPTMDLNLQRKKWGTFTLGNNLLEHKKFVDILEKNKSYQIGLESLLDAETMDRMPLSDSKELRSSYSGAKSTSFHGQDDIISASILDFASGSDTNLPRTLINRFDLKNTVMSTKNDVLDDDDGKSAMTIVNKDDAGLLSSVHKVSCSDDPKTVDENSASRRYSITNDLHQTQDMCQKNVESLERISDLVFSTEKEQEQPPMTVQTSEDNKLLEPSPLNTPLKDASIDQNEKRETLPRRNSVAINLDEAWKRRSSIVGTVENISSALQVVNLESSFTGESPDSQPLHETSVTDEVSQLNTSGENIAKKTESEKEMAQTAQLDSTTHEGKVGKDTTSPDSGDVIKTDISQKRELEINVSDEKSEGEISIGTLARQRIPEDSLSELSEIHLSCGSEQEQQKDDSDCW